MKQPITRKTILYVSNDLTMGGAPQSLIDMICYMEHFVTPIVVTASNRRLEEILKNKNITYYIVNINRGFGKIGQHTINDEEKDFVINYEAALKIKKIIIDNDVSLVHINSSVSNAGAMAALLSGIPYIWHLREIPEQQFGCEFWDKTLKQMLFEATDGFVAISDCVKQDYKKKYNIDSIRLYNIIDSGRFKQKLSTVHKKNNNIILAGNISEAKGQLEAIKAIKLLVDKGCADIKLHLIGNYDGRFKWCFDRYIQRYGIEQNVVLLPYADDLSEIRKKCMISLTTSKYEALGRVTIEAMLAGNIVIGSDTGEIPKLIGNDGERGYLYSMGDASSLADTIFRVLNEKNGHDDLLIRAQNFAEITFDGVPYAEKMNMYYDKILAENNKLMFKENAREFIEKRYKKISVRQDEIDDNIIVDKRKRIIELEEMWKSGTIAAYLKKQDITNVAIYGMGELGCRLYDELMECGIEVAAVIDRNPYFLDEIIKVYEPDEELSHIENVISTVASDFSEVRSAYKGKNVINLIKVIEDSYIVNN